MKTVAINGFGRIGRAFLRLAVKDNSLQVVAINDLGDINNLAYLLRYDSVYGRAQFDVKVEGDMIIAGNQRIKFVSEKEPTKLPWKDLGVDMVIECTGRYTDYAMAKVHLDAGAKHVIISAPAKGDAKAAGVEADMVLLGVNEARLKDCQITSNASCTTNAVSPVIVVLDETIGIEKAILNTTHAYTATQVLVDGSAKDDYRRGRAGALNMGPSSTGAAKSVGAVYAPMKGKFDGISVRVPVAAGSIADVTFIAKRPTTVEEVNQILRDAAKTERWSNVFATSDEDLVSSDILGLPYGSIADLTSTRVVDGNLVKVMAWYDNEMGYTHTLLEHVKMVAKVRS